jgi:hypothetical protein
MIFDDPTKNIRFISWPTKGISRAKIIRARPLMSEEILDEDDSGFTAGENEPEDDSPPVRHTKSGARRRIEELMELRRLQALLEDPLLEGLGDEF